MKVLRRHVAYGRVVQLKGTAGPYCYRGVQKKGIAAPSCGKVHNNGTAESCYGKVVQKKDTTEPSCGRVVHNKSIAGPCYGRGSYRIKALRRHVIYGRVVPKKGTARRCC